MADYLIVAEAEDGSWLDEGETAFTKDEARKVAAKMFLARIPEGYEVMIYPLGMPEQFSRADALKYGLVGEEGNKRQ